MKKDKSVLTSEEKKLLATGYETSGMSRLEYCQQSGIPVTTLDYYRLRRKTKAQRVVPVKVEQVEQSNAGGFVLMLGNGRRIESGWGFSESGLTRLLRIAEQA